MVDELIELLRGSQRPTRRQLRQRRRRAAALAAVAGTALLAGAVAGAPSGTSGGASLSDKAARVGWYGHFKQLAGDGRASLDSQQRVAENDAVDRTLASSPVIHTAGAQHQEMALTFDDGPGPYTEQILQLLQRYGVPATFFVVGEQLSYFSAGVTREVALGMSVGDHTQSHRDLETLKPADQQAQIIQQTSAIGSYGAPFPRLFRPPYGNWNEATLSILKKQKMLTVLWTIDSEDWQRPGVEAIVSNVVSKAAPGAIVLLHDAGGDRSQTVAALPAIIQRLRAQGYRLVTVPRLLLDNPAPPNQTPPAGLTEGGAG